MATQKGSKKKNSGHTLGYRLRMRTCVRILTCPVHLMHWTQSQPIGSGAIKVIPLLVQQVDRTITQLPLKAISCMILSFLGHQQHIYWEKM